VLQGWKGIRTRISGRSSREPWSRAGRAVTLIMNPEILSALPPEGDREIMKIKEIRQIYIVVYKYIHPAKKDLKNFLSENWCLR
jgi:hypothetical protein